MNAAPQIIHERLERISEFQLSNGGHNEGEEEAGGYGYGPTEADAIADLLDNADEYPTALASEVDPHGLFERAYAEVAGVQP